MRWLRLYDDIINDPKVLKLPEAMRWHYIAMLCVASKNRGSLPSLDDLAIMLRMTAAKALEILNALVKAGLVDRNSDGFAPHNWSERQYKSDTSAERMKRLRDRKRDASPVTVGDVTSDVTVTLQIQSTETDTETDKSSVPNGTGAKAPIDVRSELFGRGLATLASLTGKGPDACRSFVGKCLKASQDDASTVLGLIEEAERNRVIDASSWIVARLNSNGRHQPGKPLTEHQRAQHETKGILDELDNFANGGGRGREEDPRLLSHDPRERPKAVRGGAG